MTDTPLTERLEAYAQGIEPYRPGADLIASTSRAALAGSRSDATESEA